MFITMPISISPLILLATFQICSGNHGLPLFLIDNDHIMSHLDHQPNPFSKINAQHFTGMVEDAIKRSKCIINFVEDKLSTEDVTMKDKSGSPYKHLSTALKEEKVKYLPSVAEPYKTLTQLFDPQRNVFTLRSDTKIQLSNGLKYLYIYFQDEANETRAQSLRRHDAIIRDVYSTVRELKAGPVVGFYTGRASPIVTDQFKFRAAKPNSVANDLEVTVVSEGALFRFSGVFTAMQTRRATYHRAPLVAEETRSRRKMTTTMAYSDFELQFNFSFGDDQWLLDNVALLEGGEEVGRTAMGVGAPWSWSYVCGEPLCVVNTRDGSAVSISRYQIQPLRKIIKKRQDGGGGGSPEGGSDPSFGKTVNCKPYFSAQILSGLLVTSIFGSILGYGFLMLLSCGSNNKFDDPHGKEAISHVMGDHN